MMADSCGLQCRLHLRTSHPSSASRRVWSLQRPDTLLLRYWSVNALSLASFQLPPFTCGHYRLLGGLWLRQWRGCLPYDAMCCQSGRSANPGSAIWNISANHVSKVSIRPLSKSNLPVANFGSCLTGLPIMGAILEKQNYTDYSGLQLFGACCGILGSVLIGAATFLLRKMRNTSKI